jgi:hypothetical protein
VTRAWQAENGTWTVWGTHIVEAAEAAMFAHLRDEVRLDPEGDELWELLPSWSHMRDRERVRRLWADGDLIDLDGIWPPWKIGRWRPFRVRVMVVEMPCLS